VNARVCIRIVDLAGRAQHEKEMQSTSDKAPPVPLYPPLGTPNTLSAIKKSWSRGISCLFRGSTTLYTFISCNTSTEIVVIRMFQNAHQQRPSADGPSTQDTRPKRPLLSWTDTFLA